jgi:hypothetical protein
MGSTVSLCDHTGFIDIQGMIIPVQSGAYLLDADPGSWFLSENFLKLFSQKGTKPRHLHQFRHRPEHVASPRDVEDWVFWILFVVQIDDAPEPVSYFVIVTTIDHSAEIFLRANLSVRFCQNSE